MSYRPQANGRPWIVQATEIALNKNVGRAGLQYLPDCFVPQGLTFSFSTTEIEFSDLIIGWRKAGGDNSSQDLLCWPHLEQKSFFDYFYEIHQLRWFSYF